MTEGNTSTIRLVFEPSATEPFLQRFRSELQKGSVDGMTIRMDHVSYVDPSALKTLQLVGETARSAGKSIVLEGVQPGVYKALQLAKLAALFRRVHHG